MKKFKIIGLMFCLLCFCGCSKSVNTVEANRVELSKDYMAINVGSVGVINAEVFPFNSVDTVVVWRSSNEQVASVENGLIIAKKVGSVVITALLNNGEFSDYCNIDIVSGESILDEYY